MPEIPPWSRKAFRILFGCALVYVFIYRALVEPWLLDYEGGDFTIYFRAAEKLAHGESPYPLDALAARAEGEGSAIWGEYPYPPLLARLLIPLTGLEIVWAKRIYIGICLTVFFAILLPFLRRRYPMESERWAVGAILLGWGPLIYSIRLGQCELLAIPFLVLAWRFLYEPSKGTRSPESNSREVLAGICLGFAAMVRVTPLLMLPALLVAYRWRLALGFCVGAFLNLLAAGPATSFDFFTKVLPTMSDVSEMRHCPAFHVLVLRAVDMIAPHTGAPDGWTQHAALLGTVASGIFYGAVLMLLFVKRRSLETEGLVLAGLYLAPLFAGKNPHHYTLAVFPAMAAAAVLIGRARSGKGGRILLLLFLLFLIPSFDYWGPAKLLVDRFCWILSIDTVTADILGHLGAFLVILVLFTKSLQSPLPAKA